MACPTFLLTLNFDRRVMAGAQAARFFRRHGGDCWSGRKPRWYRSSNRPTPSRSRAPIADARMAAALEPVAHHDGVADPGVLTGGEAH